MKACRFISNDGSGLFTDESLRSGIGQMTTQSLTFGCFFMDYDLDGLLDIVAANGHVSDDIAVVQPTLRYAQPAGIYRNMGNRKFEDVSTKLGRAIAEASGCARDGLRRLSTTTATWTWSSPRTMARLGFSAMKTQIKTTCCA